MTSLLCSSIFFLYADQNLMSPNLSHIANEFHFTDLEKDTKLGGEIAFGFFVIGGAAALVVGYLADISHRCRLFGSMMILGEFACFWSYLCTSYDELFWCRILTGVSIGGASPIIFSLLGDLYPSSMRIYVSTLIGLAMTMGISFGQLVAGFLGPAGGYSWRLPFLVVPIPAVILGCTVLLMPEPVRGSQDIGGNSILAPHQDSHPLQEPKSTATGTSGSFHVNERLDLTRLGAIVSTPTVLLVYLQGIPGCVPWSIISVFLSDYLSNDLHFSIPEATLALTAMGVGGFIGQLVGGYVGQQLYNRGQKRLQCLLMGASTALGTVPLFLILFLSPHRDFGVEYAAAVSAAGGNAYSHALDVSASSITYLVTLFLLAGFTATITGICLLSYDQ